MKLHDSKQTLETSLISAFICFTDVTSAGFPPISYYMLLNFTPTLIIIVTYTTPTPWI